MEDWKILIEMFEKETGKDIKKCSQDSYAGEYVKWLESKILRASNSGAQQPQADNTGSPKMPASCSECPLEKICHVCPGWNNALCVDAWRKIWVGD